MASPLLSSVPQPLSRMAPPAREDDLAETLARPAPARPRKESGTRFSAQQTKAKRKPRIHLTFDDGPHPVNTPKLLDELKQAGILATFFVLGKNLNALGQEIIQRAASEGHQIGNHTYSHPHLTESTEDQIREEISRTEQLIGDANRGVKLFRPPYGEHNRLVDQVARELGYSMVLWNVDSRDWDPGYQDSWVEHALEQIVAQEESIMLAHDNQTTTVTKVGAFIARFRELSNSGFIQYSEACPRERSLLSYLRTFLPSRWRDLNHALRAHL